MNELYHLPILPPSGTLQQDVVRGMTNRAGIVLGPGSGGTDNPRSLGRTNSTGHSGPTGWSCVACPKQTTILHVFLIAVIASCSAVSLHSIHMSPEKFNAWVLNEELGLIERASSALAPEGYSNQVTSKAGPHGESQLQKDGAGVGAMGALKPMVQTASGDRLPATNSPKKRSMPEPALAVLFERYGGVDKALEVLKQSAASNPTDPVILSDLGNAYRVKGDSELAIECFEAALRIMPHPDFYLNLGGVFFALGELEEAVQMFTAGLQLNPVHALLQFSLGGVYAVLGRKEDAMRAFQATLRIQPDFDPAAQYLAQLESETRQSWWRLGYIGWVVAAGFIVVLVAVQRAVNWFVMQKPAQDMQDSTAEASNLSGRQSEHGKARLRRG